MFRIATLGRGFFAVNGYPGARRAAADELAAVAGDGIAQVVSLLEPAESRALGLDNEAELVARAGMHFVSFPIPDMGLPSRADDFTALSARLYRDVTAGVNTLIHCRAGIGRSGMLAVALLLQHGEDLGHAAQRASRARGRRMPETAEQADWLRRNRLRITASAGGAR